MFATLLDLWSSLFPKKAAKIPKWWALLLVVVAIALGAILSEIIAA